jgi:hypothetical protein
MGDRVVVTVASARAAAEAGLRSTLASTTFTVRDGKIVRMDQFAERSEAIQAAAERAQGISSSD